MPETTENQEVHEGGMERSPSTLIISGVVLAAIFASVWFLVMPSAPRKAGGKASASVLKPGSPEEVDSMSILFENVVMSRAENFLHQEVTVLNADMTNGGAQGISVLILSIEFKDKLNQVVLRELRPVLGTAALAPGEKRPIEISFENIPASWNMQAPTFRVSQLRFAAKK